MVAIRQYGSKVLCRMYCVQSVSTLLDRYVQAKEYVIDSGYGNEIDWQWNVDLKSSTESDFLREGAWVILSSGMCERVIRSRFDAISKAFCFFRSSNEIVERMEFCRSAGLKVFNHRKKVDAILSMSTRVSLEGFDEVKRNIESHGVDYLRSYDYIGPATSLHLAKNLGMNVSKPDRHLVRIASSAGFDSAQALCVEVSRLTGDSVSVVDLVIWRFATLWPNSHIFFSEPDDFIATVRY